MINNRLAMMILPVFSRLRPPSGLAVFLGCIAMFVLPAVAQSANQQVALQAGWNAVWLEVEPTYPDGHLRAGQAMAPEDVFAAHPQVITVASPKPRAGISELFGDAPGSETGTFNQDGWEQWHRGGGIGDDLVMMTGNRAYLIEVSGALAPISLEGKVRFFRPAWTADRFNLLGFGVDGTPSFDDFFGPSGGRHPVSKIYALNAATGNWATVNPSAPVEAGRAYWIFSSGPSRYMGPVAVDFAGAVSGQLDFAGPADVVTVGVSPDEIELDLEELVFTNLRLSGSPVAPELDLVAKDPGSGSLDLFVVTPAPNRLGYERGNQVDSSVGGGASADLGESVDPQSSATLTIGARRNWSGAPLDRVNLYRLKTGGGSEFWLPVRAVNSAIPITPDLTPGPDVAASAGLWVGDVTVNAVSSITENGAPTRPSAGAAPIRVLLHADASGQVTLLSQVTVMQTRSADPDVPTEPVLVVNPARAAFFEGIRERGGRKVGIRLEAAAYDMPRNLDPAAQAELVAAEPGLTTATEVRDFLNSRNLRPPELSETYHLSLPLDGTLEAGKTLLTRAGSLTLDPFHRSNPFRHAFHQMHPRGPEIRREWTITFDADQPVADRLRGTFHEVLGGVIKSDLTLTGTIELRRVSRVPNLAL